MKIVENPDICASLWNDSETPKYGTFLESAHMGAGDHKISIFLVSKDIPEGC